MDLVCVPKQVISFSVPYFAIMYNLNIKNKLCHATEMRYPLSDKCPQILSVHLVFVIWCFLFYSSIKNQRKNIHKNMDYYCPLYAVPFVGLWFTCAMLPEFPAHFQANKLFCWLG